RPVQHLALRQVGQAGGAFARAHPADRPPRPRDLSRPDRHQPADRAQQARLAGAVRTQEPDQFAGPRGQMDVAQDRPPAEVDAEAADVEPAHRRAAGSSGCSRTAMNTGAPTMAVTTPRRSSDGVGISLTSRSDNPSSTAPANAAG